MVAKPSPLGLIATTRSDATPPLDDLAACCGWPLLLDASPRRLQRQLALHVPECVLFWLDDWLGIASTAHLIAWLRQRGARPYRVAVAHQMAGDVEAVLRASGAHGFLVMTGRPGVFVADALWPLLHDVSRATTATAATSNSVVASGDHAVSWASPHDLVRPP